MAITHVKDEITSANSVTSIALAYTGGNTSGNTLFAFINVYDTLNDPADWTISDTNTNTWVRVQDVVGYNDANDNAAIYYALNCGGGANTVTVSGFNTASFATLVISEASGLDTTSALDTSGENAATSNSPTTGSVTSTVANTYWTSAVVHDQSGNQTITEDFTLVREEQDQSTYMPINVQYEIRTSTATQAHTWSFGSSKTYWAAVQVMKDTSGAGPATGFMTTNTGYWG